MRHRGTTAALAVAAWWMTAGPGGALAAPVACSIGSSSDDEIGRLLDERGFDFAGYDRLCAFLREHGMKVQITARNGVLGGRAYGWAIVTFEDRRTGVRSDRYHTSTTIDGDADTPTARLAMWQSINHALADIAARPESMAEMADDLRRQITLLRAAFSPSASAAPRP
ncbi:hypothetical protein [Sphingomonas phyllosphaerae]|uniref:hypothetical protein n=1 Tax=Sphingomonas phyllosphaerae TaxID=257003 RepID=UPI0004121CFF|nr:hypothetical protein [Sphingomonas phyllosphaerae]